MADLFRDTIVGEIVYHTSGRKLLQHKEERLGYQLSKRYTNEKLHTSSNHSDDGHSNITAPTRVDSSLEENTVVGSSHDVEHGSTPPSPKKKNKEEDQKHDPHLVDWDGPNDPANPRNWSKSKKAFVTFCLCLLTFSIYIGSSIYSPGEMDFVQEFGTNQTVATLGLTLFVFGYGIGPLFLSPVTEIPAIGRNKPYSSALFIFVVLQIPTALVHNVPGFLVLRFLAGFFGSPPLATAGASLADMYDPKSRPYALGIWGLGAVCGPVLGPLIGGFAGQALGWRWTIWPLLMLSGGTWIFLFFTLPETSAPNILARKAARLRRLTGDDKFHSAAEMEAQDMTLSQIATMTLVRPFQLMFLEPIVFLLNTYIAFVYAILYVWFEAFPIVFVDTYGFNLGQTGLTYMGLFVGAVLTYFCFCVYTRKVTEPMFEKKGGMIEPEDRLPPALVGSFFIPLCLFSFGWTSAYTIHWIVPIIMSSFFTVGAFLLFNSVLNYLQDAYAPYAASVLAGNDFFRSIVGGAFPLFAHALFINLQKNGPSNFPVSWGCTLLGCIGLVMIPIPFAFYRFGPKIRSYSKYAVHGEVSEG